MVIQNLNLIIMRIIVLLLVFISPFPLIAQTLFPEKEGKILYEEIYEVEVDKKDIYNKSKMYLVQSFRNAKNVIQIDDPDLGRIVTKGKLNVSFKGGESWSDFITQIDIKDNKFRVRVFDILTEMSVYDFQEVTTGEEKNKIVLKEMKSKLKRKFHELDIIAIDNDIKLFIAGLNVAVNSEDINDDF